MADMIFQALQLCFDAKMTCVPSEDGTGIVITGRSPAVRDPVQRTLALDGLTTDQVSQAISGIEQDLANAPSDKAHLLGVSDAS